MIQGSSGLLFLFFCSNIKGEVVHYFYAHCLLNADEHIAVGMCWDEDFVQMFPPNIWLWLLLLGGGSPWGLGVIISSLKYLLLYFPNDYERGNGVAEVFRRSFLLLREPSVDHNIDVDAPRPSDIEHFIKVPPNFGCQLTVKKKVWYGFGGWGDVAWAFGDNWNVWFGNGGVD